MMHVLVRPPAVGRGRGRGDRPRASPALGAPVSGKPRRAPVSHAGHTSQPASQPGTHTPPRATRARTQAVLQQPRELAVAVGHVRQLVHERRDDAPQRQQRLVDVARLARARVLGAGAPHGLGARQVHQVQLADAHLVRAVGAKRRSGDGDREDAVRARRLRVHERLGRRALGDALLHPAKHLVGRAHVHLLQVGHLDHAAHGRVAVELAGGAVARLDDLEPLAALGGGRAGRGRRGVLRAGGRAGGAATDVRGAA